MKNAAFIEWDKQLNRNEQRPRGVFFRQKYASVDRATLIKSPFYQSIKVAMKAKPQHVVTFGKTSEGLSVQSGEILIATPIGSGCSIVDGSGFLLLD